MEKSCEDVLQAIECLATVNLLIPYTNQNMYPELISFNELSSCDLSETYKLFSGIAILLYARGLE